MSRIVVVPEMLQAMGSQLHQAAAELTRLQHRLRALVYDIDWETRHQARVAGEVEAAVQQGAALARRLEALGRWVVLKAEAFAEADGQGGLREGSGPGSFAPQGGGAGLRSGIWTGNSIARTLASTLASWSRFGIPTFPIGQVLRLGSLMRPLGISLRDLASGPIRWLRNLVEGRLVLGGPGEAFRLRPEPAPAPIAPGAGAPRLRPDPVPPPVSPPPPRYTGDVVDRGDGVLVGREAPARPASPQPGAGLGVTPGQEAPVEGTPLSEGVPITSTERWKPVKPEVVSLPGERSASEYNRVLDQFDVENNPRYKPGTNTYCNIYVWDVTRAMGAEIPHWVDDNGNPVPVGKGEELDANKKALWLEEHGPRFGWREVTAAEAQEMANRGHPVVAAWRNPRGIGHVAPVVPGEYDPEKGPTISQAGSKNFRRATVRDGFGRLEEVRYYVHP
ncbi:MAG: hypothetical protein L6E13_04675 [Firmicutes bacterium]|nr:hypothetical protein [Bacillota bacterium]